MEDYSAVNVYTYFDDKAEIRIGRGSGIGVFCKFITSAHDKETMGESEKPIIVGKFRMDARGLFGQGKGTFL